MELDKIDSSPVGVWMEATLSDAGGSLIAPPQVGMVIRGICPPAPPPLPPPPLPPLSAASTSPPLTAAAEGRSDGLTVHFLPRRHIPRRCQGVRGLPAARELDEAEESMKRGMMKK